jgi:hypothetical protein
MLGVGIEVGEIEGNCVNVGEGVVNAAHPAESRSVIAILVDARSNFT